MIKPGSLVEITRLMIKYNFASIGVYSKESPPIGLIIEAGAYPYGASWKVLFGDQYRDISNADMKEL
jgi:hypothetical protein